MSGGQGPYRQGLQTSDDGIGVELPGNTIGTGPMSGVREGPSDGFTGYLPPNPEWSG